MPTQDHQKASENIPVSDTSPELSAVEEKEAIEVTFEEKKDDKKIYQDK